MFNKVNIMKEIIYSSIILFVLASCATSVNVDLDHMKKRKVGHINSSSYRKSAISLDDSVMKDELAKESKHLQNSNISYGEIDNLSISATSSNDLILPADSLQKSFISNHLLVNSKSINYLKDENECEEIISRNGEIIEAKIIEIGVTEIKYKKCSNIEGPSYSILKSDVFMIKYKNGDKDVFNEKKSSSSVNDSDESKIEPFSIVSISSGITGLALGIFISMAVGIILGILGIIFGVISMKKVNSEPKKYSKISPKLAQAGLITGIVITTLCTAVLLILLLLL